MDLGRGDTAVNPHPHQCLIVLDVFLSDRFWFRREGHARRGYKMNPATFVPPGRYSGRRLEVEEYRQAQGRGENAPERRRVGNAEERSSRR